jgi:hypothetical protein
MKKSLVWVVVFVLVLVLAGVANAQDDSPLPTPTSVPDPNYPPPSPGDDEALKMALLWIVGGGGAGAIAYWLMGNVSWLGDLASDKKRYVALGLSGLLAWLALGAAVGLEYLPDPGSGQAWLEQLFAIAFAAVATSQSVHGWRQLRAE